MKSFLTHLECTYCAKQHDADTLQTICTACGKVLFARYDLAHARDAIDRNAITQRRNGLWRWFEVLPVRDPAYITSLGEGGTPLLHAQRLGHTMGAHHLYIKEEGLNPTGSFKARGMSVAVSRAKELGAKALAAPSAGNAASALAAYGARAGLPVYLFMPKDVPDMMRREGHAYGGQVYLVDGLINDAGKIVRDHSAARGWFDVSTLREPYRQEGKKTMGYELAEHFDWTLPDAVLYPTGGGTGIVGMWKAFDEMEQLGWIGSKRPKMFVVQAEGCAPIVKAFQSGQRHAELFANAQTLAPGIRVPVAIGDYLILDAVRQSGGSAITVSDAEILQAMQQLAHDEGIFAAPEGAATLAGYRRLLATGLITPDDKTVLFNCGSGFKNTELFALPNLTVLNPRDPKLSAAIDESTSAPA